MLVKLSKLVLHVATCRVVPALSRALPLSACQLSNESANAVAVDSDGDGDGDSDVAFL